METMEPIRRSLPSEIVAGDGKTLVGTIPYNAATIITEKGRRFTEVIRPGAFARSLASGRDVIATFNHDPGRLLGRLASGTLSLSDGPGGLRFSVVLPDSAADIRELVQRGDLSGASFTFVIPKGGARSAGESVELIDVDLLEIGPVVTPAYRATSVGLRSTGESTLPPAARLFAELGLRLRG